MLFYPNSYQAAGDFIFGDCQIGSNALPMEHAAFTSIMKETAETNRQNLVSGLEKELSDLGFDYGEMVKSAMHLSNQTFHLTHVESPVTTNELENQIAFEFRAHCQVPEKPEQLDSVSCKYVRYWTYGRINQHEILSRQ